MPECNICAKKLKFLKNTTIQGPTGEYPAKDYECLDHGLFTIPEKPISEIWPWIKKDIEKAKAITL
ncbi:MAG TPA: hypothetical protein EYP22_08135 [Methanosarcinales archaeon]|nr:hypothetical protein [Methanosarcinales archaeon]